MLAAWRKGADASTTDRSAMAFASNIDSLSPVDNLQEAGVVSMQTIY
jgi:hypothetical protein